MEYRALQLVTDEAAGRCAYSRIMTNRRPPLAILSAVVALVQVVGTFFAAHRFGAALSWPAVLLLLSGPALLLLRRRAPGPMVAGIGAVTMLYVLAGFPWGPFPLSLAVGLIVAVIAGKRWWAWGTGAGVGLAIFTAAAQQDRITTASFAVIWLIIVLLVGELGHAATARRNEFRRVAMERAQHRRDEERLVLARDIHDVVAHSLAMINVQASVALHLSKKGGTSQTLVGALENIKAGSKESLDEVREVLSVLRQDAPRVPSQRLEQLAELVKRVRGANLEIDFRPPVLPPPDWVDERTENTIYRVAQEALTNIVRHAKAHTVGVVVEFSELEAHVCIQDDGIGFGASDEGNGLAGMRERIDSRGGSLEITSARRPGALSATPGTKINVRIPALRPGHEATERGSQ